MRDGERQCSPGRRGPTRARMWRGGDPGLKFGAPEADRRDVAVWGSKRGAGRPMPNGGGGAPATAVGESGRSAWPARAFLIAGAAATAVYFLLPEGVQNFGYDAFGLACVGAIMVGVRRNRPARPLVWLLFAGGVLLFVAGDGWLSVYQSVYGDQPFPSAADALYLAGYALL